MSSPARTDPVQARSRLAEPGRRERDDRLASVLFGGTAHRVNRSDPGHLFRANVHNAGVCLEAHQPRPICLAGVEGLHGLIGIEDNDELVTADEENDRCHGR